MTGFRMAARHKSAVENDMKSTRFRRRPPDDSDLAAIAAKTPQIRGMAVLGVKPGAIARALNLNVEGVERQLAQNPAPFLVPEGAPAERPTTPPKTDPAAPP